MSKLKSMSAALVSAGMSTLANLSCAQEPASMPAAVAATEAQPDATAIDTTPWKGTNREKDKLGTVLVTANKVLQSSSKVAASLAVLSAEELKDKGVSSAANLTDHIPNIQIGQGNLNGMEIVIRGIGSSANTEVGDPEAAFHVDGIYLGRPQGAQVPFFDLDRVEVLRGPQGTLYGRNANAGAINVISKRPGARLEGEVDVQVGNYNTRKLDAMINVPLSEALAMRAVVSSSKHDGYTKARVLGSAQVVGQDDLDAQSARLSAQLKISPAATWLLVADGYRKSGYGPATMHLINGQVSSKTDINVFLPGNVDDKGHGLTSELKLGLGAADLTYLYGHRQADSDILGSSVAAGVFNNLESHFKQNSHEIRLSSATKGRLQWVTGLYRYKETGNVDQRIYIPGAATVLGLPATVSALLASPASTCEQLAACFEVMATINGPAVVTSKAAFGQLTYALTPAWRATVGLRYNEDARSRQGQTVQLQGKAGLPATMNDASVSSSKATYKLGIEHDLSPTRMAYATVSTGYKSGGFNNGNQISPTTPGYNTSLYFKPEEITALEAGVKGRFLDGKLRLGASVFYYDYTDLQVASVVGQGNNLVLLTTNAAKARIRGAELEGAGAVSEHARVNFGLGLLDSKYLRYITAGGTDYGGHRLDRAPKATLSLGYTYDWELEGGALISAYVGARYTSSYTLTDPGSPSYGATSFTQAATTKSNLVLTWSGRDNRWKIQAFVNNIENERSMTSLTSVTRSAELTHLSEPRTAGLRASYRF